MQIPEKKAESSKAIISNQRGTIQENFSCIDDLFVIPDGVKFILYAPLSGSIMSVNSSAIQFLKEIKNGKIKNVDFSSTFVRQLIEAGILINNNTQIQPIRFFRESVEFDSKGITLFLTTKCSMRCIYCYAQGGQKLKSMKWETAKTAINWIFDHALAQCRDKIYVIFHGGGEVTTVRVLLKKCVEFVREQSSSQGIKASISAGLNGVMSDAMLGWITHNLDSATISLDGTPEVQNIQRPLSKGKNSFDRVYSTLWLDPINEIENYTK